MLGVNAVQNRLKPGAATTFINPDLAPVLLLLQAICVIMFMRRTMGLSMGGPLIMQCGMVRGAHMFRKHMMLRTMITDRF